MPQDIINGIFNFLLVSLPEETIWVVTTLILLKRFDLLDKYRWKENIKWLAIPILLSSFTICFLRYIIDAPRIFISLSAMITIYLGIIIIFKSPKNNILKEKIPYIKTFLFVIFSFAGLILFVEFLYAPFLLGYIKISIIEVNNIWLMNFLLSIPARIIQLLIIIAILYTQNRKLYMNTLRAIFIDKKISITIALFITILIIFWVMLIDVLGNYNIASQLKLNQQILLNILLIIIPSILLMLLIYLIILFIEKINKLQRSHQNMLDDIFDDDI